MGVMAYRMVGPHPQRTMWVLDTEAELPTSGTPGDTAYSKDTAKFFTHSGSGWTQVGGGGGGGGIATDTVAALDGSGAPGAATTYSRGDHRHGDTSRPTAGEKAALAGTSGTPSTSNRYVTNADPRNSDARTPTAHSHGAADLPDATTTAKGVVELATDGEATASVAVQGNDSRMSNARTPTAHASTHQPGGGDAMTVDAVAATGSLRTLGTGSQQACAGNDARLSDARSPTGHATSHQPGGSDPMTVDAVAGTGSLRTLGSGAQQACGGADTRLSDARTPTAHATSHKSGGSDAVKLDELAAPTDITTLNASTALHGLLPKLGGGTTNFLRADGTWASPPTGGSPPTGTGFRHITAGAEDAAAKLVDTADINDNQVTLAKLVDIATASFLGRTTAATGDPEVLTAAQATALLNVFTSALKGLVPASGGGTTTFLRADGTFAAPPGGGITTLRTTADQIINGTAFQDITGLTFPVAANTDYAFDFYITFRSTATTGFRFSVNGPAGVVDFFHTYQTIANSELVGVATWLQKHSVTFDQMTVTASTITAGVDLHCRMTGRFKCGGTGGTFAARAASELANNDLVIQKGSWGTWF